MILDVLADGEWHELPFGLENRAVWSAVYRLRHANCNHKSAHSSYWCDDCEDVHSRSYHCGVIEAMNREGRLPTERQKYRLR